MKDRNITISFAGTSSLLDTVEALAEKNHKSTSKTLKELVLIGLNVINTTGGSNEQDKSNN